MAHINGYMHNTLDASISKWVEGHRIDILKVEGAQARIDDGEGDRSKWLSTMETWIMYHINPLTGASEVTGSISAKLNWAG